MKKLMATLLLALAVVGPNAACNKKNDKVAIQNSGRNTRAHTDVAGSDPAQIQLEGQVYSDSQYDFQDAVGGLVSSSIPEEYLGYVSETGADGTGVFFGGKVAMANGRFGAGSSQRMEIHQGSQLLVVVWDEFAGQKDEQGNAVEAIPIYLRKATGFIAGNQADITFEDGEGRIRLQGTFDNNYFEGDMSYDNVRYSDGRTPGAAGTLGSFRIRTCSFFVCN